MAARARLPPAQQRRLRLIKDDINDTDLVSLLQSSLEAADGMSSQADIGQKASSAAEVSAVLRNGGVHDADPPQSPSGSRAFDSLLIFCNNVAFNAGTIHR